MGIGTCLLDEDQSGFHYELSVHESAEMYITIGVVSSMASMKARE